MSLSECQQTIRSTAIDSIQNPDWFRKCQYGRQERPFAFDPYHQGARVGGCRRRIVGRRYQGVCKPNLPDPEATYRALFTVAISGLVKKGQRIIQFNYCPSLAAPLITRRVNHKTSCGTISHCSRGLSPVPNGGTRGIRSE